MPEYTAGLAHGWEAVGPVHKQRYLRYSGCGGESEEASTPGVGPLLQAVQKELFASSAFAKWLLKITDLTVQVSFRLCVW